MPLNAQDLWVVLKAQDLATRALNSYSRSVRKAGTDTRLAQLEAAQGALSNRQAQLALAKATEQVAIAENNNEKAIIKQTAALRAQFGLTSTYLSNQEKQLIAQLDADTLARRRNISELNNAGIAISKEQQALKEEGQALRVSNAQIIEHQRNIEQASAKYKAFAQSAYAASFAITAVGVVGATALKKAMDAAVNYDNQVRLTFTQVDKGQASLKQLGQVGIQIADQIGIKFEDVQKSLYDVFSSMDVNMADATKYVTQFAKAAVAGQTDIDSVSRGTIAILNSFKLNASDVNHVLDLQFKFIQKGIGTYDEWVSKLGAVAPSAIRAGQSLETMYAALAVASRMSGVAAKATTAVSRSLDAISNPNAIAAMKAFGVSVLDAKGNLLPLVDILQSFRDQLDKLPSQEAKAAKVQDIFKGAGGTIEARRFLNNMLLIGGNLEQFKSILADTANSAGSMEDAYATMADSTATKTQLLKNRFNDLKITIGNAVVPYFLKLMDIINQAMAWFSRLSPRVKDLIGKFAVFATTALLIIGPIVGILGVVGSLTSALAALGLSLGEVLGVIAGAIALLVAFGLAIYKLYQNSADFRAMLKGWADSAKQAGKDIQDFADHVVGSFEKQVMPSLDHLWKVLEVNVIPAIRHLSDTWTQNYEKSFKDALKKIQDVADFGFKYLGEVIEKYLIPAINEATTFYYAHQASIDAAIKGMSELAKWVLIIVGSAVFGALIGGLIALVVGFSNLIIFITKVAQAFQFWVDEVKFVGKYISDWVKTVVGYYEFLYGAIKYYLGLAVNEFNKIKKAVGDMISNPNALYQYGKDLIQGLINGVESMLNTLVSKLNSVWNAIPSSIRNVLKISSPSKLFKQYGQYTVQGYIAGINNMQGKLNDTMANLVPTPEASGYQAQGWRDVSAVNGNNAMTSASRGVTVNVQTNEIRPEYHSARLGQLLVGRLT